MAEREVTGPGLAGSSVGARFCVLAGLRQPLPQTLTVSRTSNVPCASVCPCRRTVFCTPIGSPHPEQIGTGSASEVTRAPATLRSCDTCCS